MAATSNQKGDFFMRDLEFTPTTKSGCQPIIKQTTEETASPDEFERAKNWLESATPMDVLTGYSSELRDLVNALFDELLGITLIKNNMRFKEALKTVLLNLELARRLSVPVRYSRNKNWYSHDTRYGKLHLKYGRLIPIIDGLEVLGYVQQKTGIFNQDKGFGRQTRMWGTDQLWRLLDKHGLIDADIIEVPKHDELIVLRDDSELKTEIAYAETAETISMREDLIRYNDFVKKHLITLNLDGDVEVNNKFLLTWLQPKLSMNTVKLELVVLTQPISTLCTNTVLSNTTIQYQEVSSNSITMTNTISRIANAVLSSAHSSSPENLFDRMLSELKKAYLEITDEEQRQAFMEEMFPLSLLGVEVLIIRLCRESLHRVFNRGSFKKNGRAYGAQHQSLSKELRKHILINDQKTLEPDFSAYHMLMLYHMEGIDYADDPYTVISGLYYRDFFKSVCLIFINANCSKAWRPIKEKMEELKIQLPKVKQPYVSLLKKVREIHGPIAHHIGADKGIELQNIDSHIMNAILMRLMDMGILGLSVFDSVIVVEEFAEIARGIMIEEYQKVFGFKPRV
jgi:hypothetical protein